MTYPMQAVFLDGSGMDYTLDLNYSGGNAPLFPLEINGRWGFTVRVILIGASSVSTPNTLTILAKSLVHPDGTTALLTSTYALGIPQYTCIIDLVYTHVIGWVLQEVIKPRLV